MTPLRRSPLHDVAAALAPTWANRDGMPVPFMFDSNDNLRMAQLGIVDLSFLRRCGLKGPQSVAWLAAQGIDVPAINTWEPLTDGGLVARLGKSEFLLEDASGGTRTQKLAADLAALPAGVCPVLRQDAAFALTGAALGTLLCQTCNVNFNTVDLKTRQLALTSMVGVPVVVSPGEMAGQPCYRLWCDGTYGGYLWQTLLDIASELGGGAVGVGCLMPEAVQLINS
jgi:sarcosine oxidase subunit gamma